jgi:methyltransferase-like protein/SAM-dependent methyltransferase
MSTLIADAQSYDEVPFPTQAVPPSDPDRLAAIARLFGMPSPPVDHCRVLELGCASGGNLAPLAERFPNSRFLGIDYSGAQIASARALAIRLGLKNLEFQQASILDVGSELGKFDYIIAHGMYSWVPLEVREKMLGLLKSLLEPGGVAYASYNTFPGWCLPNIVRELVVHHTAVELPLRERLAEARNLLTFFSETLADDASAYSLLLKQEIDRALASPDGYFAHEHLGQQNTPVYFFEFVERAWAHGLQYVGDSLMHSMFPSNLPAGVEDQMHAVRHDQIAVEQYIDVLRNRAFRMSLLCHDSVPLRMRSTASALGELFFQGAFRPCGTQVDLRGEHEESFETGDGNVTSSTVGVVKAAMLHLGAAWPASKSLEALDRAVARSLDQEPGELAPSDRQTLEQFLIESLAAGLVEARSLPSDFVTVAGPRPRVSPMVREQARQAAPVTNRRHESVWLDDISRNLLPYLDGEHDRAALIELVSRATRHGRLSILRHGVPLDRGEWTLDVMEPILDQALAAIASASLLLA